MVVPVDLAADLERPEEEGLGLLVLGPDLVEGGEVEQARGVVGALLAQHPHLDLGRFPVERLRLSVLGTVLVLTFRAGESLLYPFENRPTDVPMSAITRTIEIKLLERLGADEIPPELEPTDGLYLM